MRTPLFLISLALSSVACSPVDDFNSVTGYDQEGTGSADAGATTSATAKKTGAVKFEDNAEHNGAKREFSYSWPAEVGAEPMLVAQLKAERDKTLAAQKADWVKAQAEFADDDCTACRSLSIREEWETIADLPEWLSLANYSFTFSGGAHGMSGVSALVWDRQKDVGFDPVMMFTSRVALENALGQSLCDALNAERKARDVEPMPANEQQIFDECPGLDQATVLLGSTNGATFDEIGVYFGPYVAGPYSDGAYELEFPVTASVLDAVKPEYASAFSVRR